DGISYQRSTNSFNDVIAGVTINIKGEGKATVSVQSNDEELKEKITAFVDAYNEVYQEVKVQSSYNSETGKFGTLSSTTLRGLPYELQGLMSSFAKGDSSKEVQSMIDLGMEFERDGTLTINQETLASVISNSADKVKLFFIGDSDNEVEGFADRVNSRLRTLISTGGIVEAEKTAAQSRIDDLQQYIEDQTARLDKRYDQLTKQFVALDKFMNQMTSMSAFLSGQFDSLANNWGTNNK
nr:flagellar filament capping protein FliD [Desulfobulbaceae bacterium]